MNPILPLEYLLLFGLLVVTGGSLMSWYTASKCAFPKRMLITALRGLGLAALVLLALNLGRWQHQEEATESEWAVMIDRSASMGVRDVDDQTRWAGAVSAATAIDAAAEGSGLARYYTFTDVLEPRSLQDLENLRPDGKSTDIPGAGESLLERTRTGGRQLSGIIVVSDGRQIRRTQIDDFALRARARNAPVFVVPLGGHVDERDLKMSAGRTHFVTFVGQTTRIGATLEIEGFENITPTVTLSDASGQIVETLSPVIESQAALPVEFAVTPEESGYREYVIEVAPWQGESVTHNNRITASVTILDERMRIFLAEGTPYWDSKFLVQLLRKQAHMEVTSVYRLSSKRYFKVETDASAATESAEPIFPDDMAALSRYDVIVFGKGAEYFLTAERIRRLGAYMRDQGGCVVFARGKPYHDSFPELEPLEPVSWGSHVGEGLQLRPTTAGEKSGLFGAMLPGIDDAIWSQLPDLENARWVKQVKPFATVLVEGGMKTRSGSRSVPVLISQRYGKGIVVTLNADGLWRWDFFPSVREAGRMYPQLWSQIIQWATTYSEFLPGQDYALHLSETRVFPGDPVRVRVSGRPDLPEGADIGVRVERAGSLVQRLSMVPSGGNGRQWLGVCTLDEPGAYVVSLESKREDRKPAVMALLHVVPLPTEQDNLSADSAYLERLAAASGGRILARSEVADVLDTTEEVSGALEAQNVVWDPIWDRWWALCLALVFFAGEWVVRRRSGLL